MLRLSSVMRGAVMASFIGASLHVIASGSAFAQVSVNGVTPDSAPTQTNIYVTVTGTGFQSGATLKLARSGQDDIVATNVNAASDTGISGWFKLAGAQIGQWDVVVINLDTQFAVLSNGFNVTAGQAIQTTGDNSFGQLGTGASLLAAPVLIGNVAAVAGGAAYSLAVKSDGTVWAWGYNYFGQLGDGTRTDRATPVRVQNLTGVVEVACGGQHSLARKGDGTVWAWGENLWGQVGVPGEVYYSAPVGVSGLTGVVAIAAGGLHSLVIKSDGTVWAWGSNDFGQVGDGTTEPRSTPVKVSGLADVVGIAGGTYASLAVKSDGTVWAWGSGVLVPVQVPGLTEVKAVSSGYYHSLARKSDGTVWAWGNNDYGQLGDGTTQAHSTPARVLGLTGVEEIGGGAYCSFARRGDGTVWAWGRNDLGQLGDGTTQDHFTPAQVLGLTGAVEVACGGRHCLVRKGDGTVWAWGCNDLGQLGDGMATSRSVPAQVRDLAGVVAVAGGEHHSLAVKSDGTAWAWGYNNIGQLGDGTTTNRATPARVQNLTELVAVAAGKYHSLAAKNNGTVWAWGGNWRGQLGDGTTTDCSTPVRVSGLTEVVAVAAGGYHSLAIKSDGTVWAWGDNGYGQLGDGTVTRRILPVRVKDIGGTGYLTGVVAVSCGVYHSLAVKSDGTVCAWGSNGSGQLGDGTTANRRTPVQVAGMTEAAAVAGGDAHSLTLMSDGTVWAWGSNGCGQLGDGTITSSTSPVQVKDAGGTHYLSRVAAVACGGRHSLALKEDGTVWAWGYNYFGQLGDGTATDRPTPVAVAILAEVVAIAGGGNHSIFAGSLEPAPLVAVNTWPPAGSMEIGVSNIAVSFSEDVQNVSADDLVLSVGHVLSVSGAGSSFVFEVTGVVGNVTAIIDGDITGLGGEDLRGYQWTFTSLEPLTVARITPDLAPTQTNVYVAVTGTGLLPGATLKLARTDQSDIVATDVWVDTDRISGRLMLAGAAVGRWNVIVSNPDGENTVLSDGFTVAAGKAVWMPGVSGLVRVSDLTDVVAVACGEAHTLALKSDGTAWAWGSDYYGQLGSGWPGPTWEGSSTPVQVWGLAGTVAVACGPNHSVALTSNGTVWEWGLCRPLEFITRDYTLPNRECEGGMAVAASEYLGVALLGDGGYHSWEYVPLAGSYYREYAYVDAEEAVAITGTWSHTLLLKRDGTIERWSSDDQQNWGVVTGAVAVAGGGGHALALRTDGTVWARGVNNDGQLGDGTTTSRSTWLQVPGLTGVTTIAAGYSHSLALKSDGAVWVWGDNESGQLGDGTTEDRSIPVPVLGVTGVVAIAGGYDCSVFVGDDIPLVTGTWPAAGAIETDVHSITVLFSQNVQNVSADDLALSVGQVLSVSGAGNSYVFQVSGVVGEVTAIIDGDIADLGGNDLQAYQWTFTSLPDSDGDGVPDPSDLCPNTIPSSPVDAQGCPPVIFGDFDRDGDVDADDLDTFEGCATGPAIPYDPQSPPGGCTLEVIEGFLPPDHDQDTDVDQADFGMFQRCFSGTNRPGRVGCDAADTTEPPAGMELIPAGEFQMGDTFNEGNKEQPVHAVYVDGFFMDRTEVTNQQYADALNWAKSQGNLITVSYNVVYKYNSSILYCSTALGSSYSRITWNGTTFGVVAGKEDHPMAMVSWYGSAAYANWRSGMQGRPLGYDLSTWSCNWNSGYRLPTEAEWERAARGGVAGHRFPWSDNDDIQHARANYYSSNDYSYDDSPTRGDHPLWGIGAWPYTSPVGFFNGGLRYKADFGWPGTPTSYQTSHGASNYGLYDMAGNVWEWCNDWYSSTYYQWCVDNCGTPCANPRGPATGDVSPVLRGGCWECDASRCRVAARGGIGGGRSAWSRSIGFRLALNSE